MCFLLLCFISLARLGLQQLYPKWFFEIKIHKKKTPVFFFQDLSLVKKTMFKRLGASSAFQKPFKAFGLLKNWKRWPRSDLWKGVLSVASTRSLWAYWTPKVVPFFGRHLQSELCEITGKTLCNPHSVFQKVKMWEASVWHPPENERMPPSKKKGPFPMEMNHLPTFEYQKIC